MSLYAMLTGAPPFVGDTLLATCVPRFDVLIWLLLRSALRIMEALTRIRATRSYELISAAPLQLPAALASSPGALALLRLRFPGPQNAAR